jgi:hypothetical protein
VTRAEAITHFKLGDWTTYVVKGNVMWLLNYHSGIFLPIALDEENAMNGTYIYHAGTTAYFTDASTAETMTDAQLIHSAYRACHESKLVTEGYAKKQRDGGGEGTLWGKVST